MCTEVELTDAQKRAATKLRASRPATADSPNAWDEWNARVARAVDGMGGPQANEFCDLAGVP
jgi:hypothetical protein